MGSWPLGLLLVLGARGGCAITHTKSLQKAAAENDMPRSKISNATSAAAKSRNVSTMTGTVLRPCEATDISRQRLLRPGGGRDPGGRWRRARASLNPVSYTHLTLPTIYSV